MNPHSVMALLALFTLASFIHAAPTAVRNEVEEVKSFEGIAGIFGRKIPIFSCGISGVRCFNGPVERSLEASSILSHVLGLKIPSITCSLPGVHCAFTDNNGVVSVTGSSTVHHSSIEARRLPPLWSSCGFVGITCAKDLEVIEPTVEDVEVSEPLELVNDPPIEARFPPLWSSCGFVGITCAVEDKEEVVVDDDSIIPWAPSTLATYGQPAPTNT